MEIGNRDMSHTKMQIKLAKAPAHQKKTTTSGSWNIVVGMQRISCFNICAAAPRAMLLTCTTEWGEWELRPVPSRDLLINSSSSLRGTLILCVRVNTTYLMASLPTYIGLWLLVSLESFMLQEQDGWVGYDGPYHWQLQLLRCWSPDFGTSVFRNNYV